MVSRNVEGVSTQEKPQRDHQGHTSFVHTSVDSRQGPHKGEAYGTQSTKSYSFAKYAPGKTPHNHKAYQVTGATKKSSQKRATLDENEANLSSGKRGRNEEPDTSDFDENRLSMTPTRTQVIARTILTPNKPTVSKSMYDNYAAHVICAFHATLGYVKATSEERFYEDIKKMLEVGNQLVLTESCYETGSNI
ncbi:hypothetical protein BC936DRAFT_145888 [Jimgerdemannia flammicorona]|nr:hypothetical protein BC936DRAFT_145888 [Jimgerdemannia flammicorona]